MSAGQVRSGRTAGDPVHPVEPDRGTVHEPDAVPVVGRGQVARLVRDGLGGRGGTVLRPGTAQADTLLRRSALVVVVPAGELPPDRATDVVDEVRGALEAARAADVGHVVVVTSAMAYGAGPGREPAADADPVSGRDDAQGVLGTLLAVEGVVAGSGIDPARLAVLRPSVVVGPGVDTILTRHFEAPRLLTVRDGARTWQLLHTDDLVAAIRHVLARRLVGTMTIGASDAAGEPDDLDAAEVLEASGMRPVTLPALTAFGMADQLHRARVLPAGGDDLAFVVYPWSVRPTTLTASGWRTQRTSRETLDVLLEQTRGRTALAGRRVAGRDAAALGAAGAAVAALATAAVWKQARSRGR